MTSTPVQGHPLMAKSTSSYTPITPSDLEAHSIFSTRHIGPREHDAQAMLQSIGLSSMDALIDQGGAGGHSARWRVGSTRGSDRVQALA